MSNRSDELVPANAGPALIDQLGAVVAFERRDGSMAMCSWAGEAVAAWARFDVEAPQELPMARMREHIVEAMPRGRGDGRPTPGFWAIICFKAPNIRAEAETEAPR